MSDATEIAKSGIDLVEKYADKLGEVINQYSGPAADLALAVGRVAAIKEIVVGLACAVAAGFAVRYLVKLFPVAKRHWDDVDEGAVASSLGCMGLGVLGGCLSIGAFNSLTNVFAWVGMFEPSIYLAAKALDL